jgi:predicted RND superfamily exporter protein
LTHVDAVSYVTMVMSIGLLVDFIMHVLLRYYEINGDRETKTKEMLRTMGSSVLILGGISTFLGVVPLACL